MNVIKDEDLVKEQMKTISNLQDKIRLLQFDIIDNTKKITFLKTLMSRRKETNNRAIKLLEEMKKNKDFKNINNVILMLKKSYSREQIDYDEE